MLLLWLLVVWVALVSGGVLVFVDGGCCVSVVGWVVSGEWWMH